MAATSEAVAVDAVDRRRSRRSQSRAALSTSVSSTGWRSVGEAAMTRRTSAVAVCCSSASLRSRLRCSSSWNSRAFSMAMTAWSANVSSSAICCSVNGRTSIRTSADRRRSGSSSRSSGTAEHGAVAERALMSRAPRDTRSSAVTSATSWTWIGRRRVHRPIRPATEPACSVGYRCSPTATSLADDPVTPRRAEQAVALAALDQRRRRASQRRAALSTIACRTACEVGRRRGDDPQHLGGGGLLLQRLDCRLGGCAAPTPRTAGRSRWR